MIVRVSIVGCGGGGEPAEVGRLVLARRDELRDEQLLNMPEREQAHFQLLNLRREEELVVELVIVRTFAFVPGQRLAERVLVVREGIEDLAHGAH